MTSSSGSAQMTRLLATFGVEMAPRTVVVNKTAGDVSDVSIMRPGLFGNPFEIGKDGTRAEVIAKFAAYFHDRIQHDVFFRLEVESLRGKRLGCCCKRPDMDVACHGDVIAAHLNAACAPAGPPAALAGALSGGERVGADDAGRAVSPPTSGGDTESGAPAIPASLPAVATLAEVQRYVLAHRTDKNGVACPACGRLAKLYDRPLYKAMVLWLMDLVRVYIDRGAEGQWISIHELIEQRGGDYAKLRHWGLAELAEKSDENDPRRTSALWRPLGLGIDFIYGRVRVPAYVTIYANELIGASKEVVSVYEALDGFNYEALMAGTRATIEAAMASLKPGARVGLDTPARGRRRG